MRFYVILLMLIPATLSAQKDVEGWGKVKWGMMSKEIVGLYPGQITKMQKVDEWDSPGLRGYAKIGIEEIQIGKTAFAVRFVMDQNTDKLVGVYLSPKEDNPSAIIFDLVEELLTEKYGKSAYNLKEPNRKRASWFFPSTNITLEYLEVGDGSYRMLNLVYSKKKSSDGL